MRRMKYLLPVLGLAAVVMAAGCESSWWGLKEGLAPFTWPELNDTAKFVFEYEYIPDAVVMRMDTMPRWQQGRYVFERGADSLLVVSRVTSWSDTATREERAEGKEGKPVPGMEEHILERLWFCIPQGTPVGAQIDLEKLSYRFRVDYDAGLLKGKDAGQFVQPFNVLGKLRVLAITGDAVRVHINMSVKPKRATEWLVDATVDVPIAREGIRAGTAPADTMVAPVARAGELVEGIVLPTATQPATQPASAATQPGATTQPMASATTRPGATTRPATTQGAGNTMAGMWWGRDGIWEVRFQLDTDGTFVQSSSRVGYIPGVAKGDWSVKDNHLVLHTKSIFFGTQDGGVGKDVEYCLLRFKWDDGGTAEIDGQIPRPENVKHWVLHRAVFPDMNMVPPPWFDGKYAPPDAGLGR